MLRSFFIFFSFNCWLPWIRRNISVLYAGGTGGRSESAAWISENCSGRAFIALKTKKKENLKCRKMLNDKSEEDELTNSFFRMNGSIKLVSTSLILLSRPFFPSLISHPRFRNISMKYFLHSDFSPCQHQVEHEQFVFTANFEPWRNGESLLENAFKKNEKFHPYP